MTRDGYSLDLFEHLEPPQTREPIGVDAVVLRGFARAMDGRLLAAIAEVAATAPFRHMQTPGGHTMSAALTCCGALGWVTDRAGYRYQPDDPQTGAPWPDMPPVFRSLAQSAAAEAGFAGFEPDSCLINRYRPGARMGLHQDRNERDFAQPIVSVSLGLPMVFQFGGDRRSDPRTNVPLSHGDVVVWGGASRLSYHGVLTLKPGQHPLTGDCRYNLTFRRAG